jgi:two-component system OmpR family response regulator
VSSGCHLRFIRTRKNERLRVLIVEDELRMASLIRRGLINEGVAADIAAKGEDALWLAQAHDYDALVLDVMLPDLDGFEVCRRLRGAGVWAPVLMLTARDSVDDRVAGLDSGADDYLVKPFAFAELLARLRALARRADAERPAVLVVSDLRLDPATREVMRGATPIALSAKEFALLETFMRRAGDVLSRLYLLEHADVFVPRSLRETRSGSAALMRVCVIGVLVIVVRVNRRARGRSLLCERCSTSPR